MKIKFSWQTQNENDMYVKKSYNKQKNSTQILKWKKNVDDDDDDDLMTKWAWNWHTLGRW